MLANTKRKIFFFFLFYLFSFSITSNFFLVIGTFMGERLAYFPLIGFSVLIVLLFLKLRKFETLGKIIFPLLGVYIGFFAFQTFKRLPIWENNIVLFSSSLEDNTLSPKIPFIRGIHLTILGEYEEAIESYEEAIFRDPTMMISAKFLIRTLILNREVAKARYWITKYLELNKGDPEIEGYAKDLEIRLK